MGGANAAFSSFSVLPFQRMGAQKVWSEVLCWKSGIYQIQQPKPDSTDTYKQDQPKKQQLPNVLDHDLCFQRMASLGGHVMLQQRLPVQQLFNNNRQQPIMATNNYRPGSTNNYQQMTRNRRPQIAKKQQLQSSARIGEKSFMSTGKYRQQDINMMGSSNQIPCTITIGWPSLLI